MPSRAISDLANAVGRSYTTHPLSRTLCIGGPEGPCTLSLVGLWLPLAPPEILIRFLEIDFDGLGARAARNYDLFWHIASFFVFCFYFYQFRVAIRNFALRARGLINNSSFSAVIGFLFSTLNFDSSPKSV